MEQVTEQQLQEALSVLEREHAKYREEFKEWKIKNMKLLGTDSYNLYVKKFMDWEMDVNRRKQNYKEKLAAIRASQEAAVAAAQPRIVVAPSVSALPTMAPSTSGPHNIDASIREQLETMRPMEFLMAMMTTSMKDATFLPAFLAAYHAVNNEAKTQPIPNLVTFSSESQRRAHEAMAAAQQASNKFNSQAPAIVGSNSAAYGYAARPDLGAGPSKNFPAPGQPLPEGWVREPAIQKAYRPPSPIRDYRNPPQLPFRDFTQS